MFGLGLNFSLSLGKGYEGAGQLAKVGRLSPNTPDTNLPLPMSTFAVMKGLAHSFTSLRSVVSHCRRDGASREHPEDLGVRRNTPAPTGCCSKAAPQSAVSKLRLSEFVNRDCQFHNTDRTMVLSVHLMSRGIAGLGAPDCHHRSR
jgi:hypothetical protein